MKYAGNGRKDYSLTNDEVFSLFGAIEYRIKQMKQVMEEPSAKKDGRYEAAKYEIEKLRSVEETLGF